MAYRWLASGSRRLLHQCDSRFSPISRTALRLRGMQSRCFANEVIISVRDLTFEYVQRIPVLDQINFNIRQNNKVTIMGQNGSGKTTILKLLSGQYTADSGEINIKDKLVISYARQVMPREAGKLTLWEFFKDALHGNDSGLDSRIAAVMNKVNLDASNQRLIRTFSGGQQARLLLASALIMEPDMLLLDEPTNNLDVAGVSFLRDFIKNMDKTVLVISHDETFLNYFTDTVLYLDVHTKKVEQYDGDYNTVKADIARRIASENAKNAQLIKSAKAKKDQANKFANKGGGMRKAAQKLKDEAIKMEGEIVSVRKEDKTLPKFEIPLQEEFSGRGAPQLMIELCGARDPLFKDRFVEFAAGGIAVYKGMHVRIVGPNGIGKSTLLNDLVDGKLEGSYVNKAANIGYYRQDFSSLDFDQTVMTALQRASEHQHTEQEMRKIAASFFINNDVVKQKVGSLSEGQKGLLALTCLVLQQPSILIVDEPTNHINFRHLPALAHALNSYNGALLLVSHDDNFVKKIRIDDVIDLGAELNA